MAFRVALTWAAVIVAAAAAQDTRITPPDGPGKWACCSDASLLPAEDPAKGEVPMPGAAPGWDAFHLFTSDTWRLHCVAGARLTREFGSPQVVVLDEKGRCIILQADSGKWLPTVVVEDGKASSAWAHGDLDPRVDREEVYVGGGSGTIYQVVVRDRKWTSTPVASAPGVPWSKLLIDDFAIRAWAATACVSATRTTRPSPIASRRAPVYPRSGRSGQTGRTIGPDRLRVRATRENAERDTDRDSVSHGVTVTCDDKSFE